MIKVTNLVNCMDLVNGANMHSYDHCININDELY